MIALELNGQLVYQGSWTLKLQEMIGLVGNKQPRLPFETSSGTLRNVGYSKPTLDKYQEVGTETGQLSNDEWLISAAAKDISIESAKAQAKAEISQKRYEVETGGIFLNNKFYATDRDSQSAISRMTGTVSWKAAATVVKDVVQEDESTVEITFISASEFVDTDMDALKTAVAAHVAAAYAKEKEFLTSINAADTIAALRLINLASGWSEVPLKD
tara:strand:+ start:154 stop:798 length:645 start_codon:yes stop_codon:yes gene_type:complete